MKPLTNKDNRLTPSHAIKKGVRYSYYVSTQKTQIKAHESNCDDNDINHRNESGKVKTDWRIPAKQIDQSVLNILSDNLTDPIKLSAMFPTSDMTIEQHRALTNGATKLATQLHNSNPMSQRMLLSKLLKRVDLHQNKIALGVDVVRLGSQLKIDTSNNHDQIPTNSIHRIEVPYKLKKRGVEARLVIGQNKHQEPKPDQQLIMLIAKAHDFLNKLNNGVAGSISELAKTETQSASQISRMLQFTFLAPEIIESIVEGTQPADLTAEKLRRLSFLPFNWNEQKQLLGFAS